LILTAPVLMAVTVSS